MGFDFFTIAERCTKKEGYTVQAGFNIDRPRDIMTRGKAFYAIYDPDEGVWVKDEFKVIHVVDDAIRKRVAELKEETGQEVHGLYLHNSLSSGWKQYRSYITLMPDNFHTLDDKIVFANDETTREDYISKKLPYSLDKVNEPKNYNLLMDTLYSPEERRKLEWAIGSIFTGASKTIQKFIVLYGDAGSGKSTFLNIVAQLFEGYTASFEAKQLGLSSAQFSMEQFKDNPLVAIQHDGDLSRIEDNTRLNSIISHEKMIMHEKYKSDYEIQLSSFLFMGTNSPVKITNAKSGIIRRLIEVTPTGNKLQIGMYRKVLKAIPFELGAIAYHCIQVFEKYGPEYYNDYVPLGMMYKTNRFFNFVEANYSEFLGEYITLTRAFDLYKRYCEDALEDGYRLTKSLFREELKNYFHEFHDRIMIRGDHMRSVYIGFKTEMFEYTKLDDKPSEKIEEVGLVLSCTTSLVDVLLADCIAQYASEEEIPSMKWDNVTTKLSQLDTSRLHYVRPPLNHIVIDFDLKDSDGNKSAKLNLIEAAKWPSTYAEFSKGGNGVHLHYIYDGDVNKLSSVYSPGIEVKVFNGKSSLRRRVSYCNDIPVAHISSGLPFKEDKKVVNFDRISNEQAIRTLILRNLRKEIHPATKPSVDFIYKILEDAYNGGVVYDVRDLRPDIISFAARSSHQSQYCLNLVSKMQFKSEEDGLGEEFPEDSELVFYDVESFPNVFMVCWKIQGEDHTVHKMINPKPQDIERLMRMKLVGFNSKKYDAHMIYGCYIGESPYELYCRSQRLVSRDNNRQSSGYIKEAFNVDYVDIFDFASDKRSLKKWEIELGIHHLENSYPWDEPLAEEHWDEVADYCCNDVIATEAVFNHLSGDFIAREILADIAGMPVNTSTNTLTARIIFGNEKHPELVYTDLKTGEQTPKGNRSDSNNKFPEYELRWIKDAKGQSKPHNFFRGVDVGMGGYVYAEPGMYTTVALLDSASHHPTSAIELDYFGKRTPRFKEILAARLAIKHGDFESAKKMFNGKLAKYLDDPTKAAQLAQALKIAINSVYGLTSAKFENPFYNKKNVNNIVALRGALFMKMLQDEVASRGFTVAHIKTDSIKIPNATPEIIQFVFDFGKSYGYTFEHEATYDRMCLVNDAVYIAKYLNADACQSMYGYVPDKNRKKAGKWDATGAQFAHPFVFKTLFSKEPVVFRDMCETKSVTTALYLDFNERLPDVSLFEKELIERGKPADKQKLNLAMSSYSDEDLVREIAAGHNYKFVGKVGLFTPIQSDCGGGLLMAGRDDKYSAAVGTKGYRWMESEMVQSVGLEDKVDLGYYRHLVDDAIDNISKYGDFEWFANDDDPPSEMNHPLSENDVPWFMPCGDESKTVCEECSEFETCPYLRKEKMA